MSLTSPVFLALVIVLLVGSIAAAAALLPRTRRTVRGYLARVLTLVGVSLLALLATAVAVNDQFVFYVDWADLASGAQQSQQSEQGGGPAAKALTAPVPGPTLTASPPRSLPPLPKPGERVQTYSFTGAHSHLTGRIVVLLPADYEQAAQAEHDYPVLEAFHGFPGNPEVWAQAFPVLPAVDAAVGQRALAAPIVVAPQIEFPTATDTECVNGAQGQPQVETWVSQDVPEFVARTLRVRTDRASWSTIGYSSGAYCAAMTTMLHPSVFGSGIILGGYFAPQFDKGKRPFPAAGPEATRYDLVALARSNPPACALWVETSKADGLSYPSSAALLAAAKPPLAVQSTVLESSGHRASVWVDLLPQALGWLGSTSPGFAPAP